MVKRAVHGKGLFITGTDTGVGKTVATLALMRFFQSRGLNVVGMKPVATGALWRDGRWVNEDALALQRAGSVTLDYEQVNPYLFEPPASPHIAAIKAGCEIDLRRIVQIYRELEEWADLVLVEGIGGWLVPLNERERVADLARALNVPVVLVVGLRLGCLNHALLTGAAIATGGVAWAGWIGNSLQRDFLFMAENLETLQAGLSPPLLGVLPYQDERGERADISDFGSGLYSDETLHVLASSVTFSRI
jgi:dethiobiotin synthetase